MSSPPLPGDWGLRTGWWILSFKFYNSIAFLELGLGLRISLTYLEYEYFFWRSNYLVSVLSASLSLASSSALIVLS
jgi:hypothetical protein